MGLRAKYGDLPVAQTKQAKEEALHSYESTHQEECTPIESEDQFYGVSRGANRLEKYVQWVYVPAVKDATEEGHETKNTAIGRLLARRVHSHLNLSEPLEELRRSATEQYQKLI